MSDLMERLAALEATPDLGPADPHGDLTRGRRALARRRHARQARTLGLAAVVAAVAVGLELPDDDESGTPYAGTPPTSQSPTPNPSGSLSEPEGLRLVAYTGAAPDGFAVARVPEGFVIHASGPHRLLMSSADDPDPTADFEDKILVQVESVDAPTSGTPVAVGEHPGRLRHTLDGAQVVTWSDGRVTVMVQSWPGLLSDASVVELAAGIEVVGDPETPVG